MKFSLLANIVFIAGALAAPTPGGGNGGNGGNGGGGQDVRTIYIPLFSFA